MIDDGRDWAALQTLRARIALRSAIARLSRERIELRIIADQIDAPTPARVIARIAPQS
jgi:dTDP-4-dehydrorhamnose reductase